MAIVTGAVNDDTTLSKASRTSALIAGVIAVPATSDALGCCVTTHWRTTATAVALTVSGVTLPVEAVMVCTPTGAPSVHTAVAVPSGAVTTVAGATAPNVAPAANATVAPDFGFPFTSVTSTLMGSSGAPASAVCPPPDTSVTLAAGPVTMLNTFVETGVSVPDVACST